MLLSQAFIMILAFFDNFKRHICLKSQVLIHHRAPIILPDVKEPDVELIYQSSK